MIHPNIDFTNNPNVLEGVDTVILLPSQEIDGNVEHYGKDLSVSFEDESFQAEFWSVYIRLHSGLSYHVADAKSVLDAKAFRDFLLNFNRSYSPRKYFLFGEAAYQLDYGHPIEMVKKTLDYGDGAIWWGDPAAQWDDMLANFEGWENYTELTEEQFNYLKNNIE